MENSNGQALDIIVWFDEAKIKADMASIITNVYSNKNITTAEQLDNLSVEEKLKIIREIKEQNTNQIINSCVDYTKKCSQLIQNLSDTIYVDSYAPIAYIKLNSSQILQLSKITEIKNIYLNEEATSTPMLSTSRQVIESDIVQTNPILGATGDGVYIGMIDASIPDISSTELSNANINIESSYINQTPHYHATAVAKVMVSQQSSRCAKGIAPNATLFCTAVPINTENHDHALKWLINNNVEIVDFTATIEGDYTIKIVRVSTTNQTSVQYAYAWA